MDNILFRYFNGNIFNLANYKKILEDKIHVIRSAIGFYNRDITFYIFDPDLRRKYEEKNDLFCIILAKTDVGSGIKRPYSGRDYGYCIPEKKEIYISTIAIQSPLFSFSGNNVFSVLGQSRRANSDLLANVIIDEITHFQTGADHGQLKYDTKLNENLTRYYNSL